ncbi:MAG TPA: GDSL-type esterase/lipase family protein [Candidatus Binatia bacterium]
MQRAKILAAAAVLVLSAATAADARLDVVARLDLPGSARPTSLVADATGRLLYLATLRRPRHDELYAIDVGPDGRDAQLAWSLEIGASVHALAIDGSRLYLATSHDAEELVIVDTDLRSRVGSFDAPGRADGLLVEVLEPGVVLLGRRRSADPESFRLDVRDPANVVVLEASEARRSAWPAKPEPLPRSSYRGRLVGRIDRPSEHGVLHYVAVGDRKAELQILEDRPPVRFADVDGDGIYRLGCLGDSNTVDHSEQASWCTLLAAAIDDPTFEVINVAVAGATVTKNLKLDSDATSQMAQVLAHRPDAVVLAFGTNDLFQLRSPAVILAAYLAQEARALAAGVAFYVATTPPHAACRNRGCLALEETNRLLRESFPGRLLEFFDGFTAEHFLADGYHLNEAGQRLRAERAFELFALL